MEGWASCEPTQWNTLQPVAIPNQCLQKMLLAQDLVPAAAMDSCSLYGQSKTGSCQTFSHCYTEQGSRAALVSLHFHPWWWIWRLKPNFLCFWTPTKRNPSKPVAFFITSEELLQQLPTSGTQIPFLKITHSSLQERLNDFFPPPKQILVSVI